MSREIQQSGMTLVEVLVTMGLLSAFLVVIATLFTSSVDVQLRSRSYSTVVTDGRFVMERLNYDIARASTIAIPDSLGGSGSALSLTINGDTYSYQLQNGQLELTDPSGAGMLTSQGDTVTDLTFTRLGNSGGLDAISYHFTLTAGTGHPTDADQQTFTSTVERRS